MIVYSLLGFILCYQVRVDYNRGAWQSSRLAVRSARVQRLWLVGIR